MNTSTIKHIGYLAAAAFAASMAMGSAALADAKGELEIWWMGDKPVKGMQKVGDTFKSKMGVTVKVSAPEDAIGKFEKAAASGTGPDVLCWAHDRAGDLVRSGLLHAVNPSAKVKRSLEKVGWDAFSINGKVWGYPISVEAIGLIYNKKLVKNPPKTFEAVLALDKKLKKNGVSAILWDYTNTYFTWPLLAANGGYIFKSAGGKYVLTDVGVNNAGAVKGLDMLLKLINDGVMPKGAKYDDMMKNFVDGKVAMIITGPWEWGNLRAKKIDFGVTALPSVAGKRSKPLVGVQGCMINKSSPDKDLAVSFFENYVLTPSGLKSLNNDVPLGVPAHKGFYRQLAKDPLIKATMANAKAGVPMPNAAKMGAFWAAMGPALQAATNGKQSAKAALDAAATRMKR